MAEDLRSYPVANMVQGVSQQAPQNRRETQCESQFDCINSPVLGCDARPGFEFNSLLVDAQYTDSFFYEIKRGTSEHYLVVVTKIDTAGDLEVFNLNTGEPCTITFESGSEDYLASIAAPKDIFKATTVEDYTFLVNREVVPDIDETVLSDAERNEAIVYWKASAYKITYQLAITINDIVYTWSYITPDNSAAGNAEFITTNAVAATFYRTLTGLAAVPTASGTAATSTNRGVGAANAGETTGTGAVTALSLGFTVRLNGNVILISRSDATPFSVDTADGVGDTYMKSVKENVQSFSELPKNAFLGFRTKVKGSNKETADDYFIEFKEGDGSQGYWQETVAPGTPLGFDPDTMPHALVNTGPDAFTFKIAPWGFRVSGDGIDSAKDPSFVGQQIFDMCYDNNRLAIVTEGACVWSKLNDPFVYFPSSAQTTLATDPVDAKVGGGKQIVLLRKAVQTDESTFLWAQKAQFRVSSGQDSFRQDTVQSKKSTSFEFAEIPDPLPVADSLYFVTEPGKFATVRDLTISQGQAGGVQDVTAHVKLYIPSGVRRMAASDTLGIMALTTDEAPTNLYIYNFLVGNNDYGAVTRLQSAWNTWRLPNMGQVLWVTIQANKMDMVIQRPEGVILATMDLSQDRTDEGHSDYLTRLDLRITEDNVLMSYNATTKWTTITLPYDALEAEGDEDREVNERKLFVVTRTTAGAHLRGKVWPILEVTGNQVVVDGDCSAAEIYIGMRITAERTESRFFIRSPQGMVPTTRIQVVNYVVSHSKSGYYRAEVTHKGRAVPTKQEWTGRVVGSQDNLIGSYPITDGQLVVPVNQEGFAYSLRLVNDSFLPSRWQTSEYQYLATKIATNNPPRGAGRAGQGQ